MEFLYVLESIRTPILDAFFSLITHFGEETLFILIGLLFFWCIDKKEGYYLLCIGLIGTIVNQFLKLLFRIPRPWVRDPQFTIVESARAEATGYSFPSGHTQVSVGVYGGIARWTGKSLLSTLCLALCILVPLSRMYLGVHTPADVLVSVILALTMVFVLHPIIAKGFDQPKVMRTVLALMLAGSALLLGYVTLFPFPADTDAHNLASGIKNGYTMLGCTPALLLTYEIDHRYIRFETKATLAAQAVKLIPGLLLLLGIKSGLKAPLNALFGGSHVADAVRYFFVVAFAGCVWPMTFPWITRKFSR